VGRPRCIGVEVADPSGRGGVCWLEMAEPSVYRSPSGSSTGAKGLAAPKPSSPQRRWSDERLRGGASPRSAETVVAEVLDQRPTTSSSARSSRARHRAARHR
jgi:hypothetical protein